MDEPLINIIAYFRKLARQHVEVKSFAVGEEYEVNDFDNITYPLIWLELPFESSIVDFLNPDSISVTFNLHSMTNIIKNKFGNDVQVTESMISKSTNQINLTTLAKQDELMNNAYRILMTIITRFVYEASENEMRVNDEKFTATVESVSVTNVERYGVKDLYKSSSTITVTIDNTYLCPIDTYFDYNK